MINNNKTWNKLFLLCFGLFAGTAFCMKWMEGDFVENGSVFTIIGLEATYSKERVMALLSGLDGTVKTIVRYHLFFDFAFMAGVYPGIACLCMTARKRKIGKWVQAFLLGLALLQLVAWGCDIAENRFLLKWIDKPESISSFGVYHVVVYTKWIIALAGALVAIAILLVRKKRVAADE
jgi:hypothetical protein